MFWPFKRRERDAEKPETEGPDVFDQAAQNLIDQGVDPRKVHRAARLVKRYAREGVLPEGYARPPEE